MTSQPIDHSVMIARRRKIEWLPYLLSLPALLVCIGILIPFVTALYYSALRFRLNLPALKGFIGFGNYTNLIYDPEFWNTVSISLRYTAITVGVELLLGLTIALLLQRQTRVNNLISVLLLLPLMPAPAIAALMWKLMTNPNFGILSYLVSLAGVSDFRWASSPASALFTVVLVDVWVYTPFIMVLLLAGLRSLPPQPFEAAALDGVPRLFVFYRITLPMLSPYIITASLFRVLDSIQQFDIIYAMTVGAWQHAAGVSGASTRVLPIHHVGKSALLVVLAITHFLSNIFIKHWLRPQRAAHRVSEWRWTAPLNVLLQESC